jgi:hypothetical protein
VEAQVDARIRFSDMFLPLVGAALCLLAMGCQPKPVTSGAALELPKPKERLLVVGNQPSAVSTAVTWLERQGLAVMETPGMLITYPDHTTLEQSRRLGAETLVWVQLTGDLRAPMVAVRGIDPHTNAVRWTGHARLDSYGGSPAQDVIARLTCRALAATWNQDEDRACP